MNEKKLIDALDYIKSVCMQRNCVYCPLSDDKLNCMVTKYRPMYWELTNKLPEKWSAFSIEYMER